jgi:hypothetical protein
VEHGSPQVPGPADVKYQSANPLGKPVLDQDMFQQLLSAAYTLQVQNHPLPAKEPVLAAAESNVEPLASSTLSPLQPELESSAKVPALAPEVGLAASLKPLRPKPAKLGLRALHPAPTAPARSRQTMVHRRISPHNDLFWKAATVAAMAAVSALLFAAWIDQPSPLPPGLTLPQEVLQQQVPFRRAEPVVTSQTQSGRGSTRMIVMQPPAATRTESTVVDEPTEGAIASGTARKTTANLNRHSSFESEADLVAPDTVVRYSSPSARVQGKP